MAFLPHGISHSLKAMLIPMLHVCLAVKIADARSQDFTTCKLIILSLQPLLLLAPPIATLKEFSTWSRHA